MAELKVIEGGDISVGSEKWSTSVRDNAKKLAGNLDEGYMELARLLWKIYDTPIDGDPKNPAVYTQWGYSSFGDYVEEELGIHRKKAQRLRRIWFFLEYQLADVLTDAMKQRITALGMSKARELVGVLTAKNIDKWVEQAEKLSFPQLVMAIREYKEDRRKHAELKAAAELEDVLPDVIPPEGEGGEGGGGDGLPAPVDAVVTSDDDYEIPVPDFDPDAIKRENFALYEEQYEIVQEALALAKKLSGSMVKSNNLHLICLDFLATNDDGKSSKHQRLKRLNQIAQSYDYKIVVVDEGDVVFGLETLEELAKDS